MKNTILACVLVCGALQLSGCTTLSRSDEVRLRQLNAVGIDSTEVQVKHPGVAGGLNLLPGFGNFYLASGTNESSQWMYGFMNLLFWPVSIIWGVPQAATDAETINKKETVYYYTYDPIGRQELEQRREELGLAEEAPTEVPPSVQSLNMENNELQPHTR